MKIFKKWWFWVIVVIVIVGLANMGKDDNQTTSNQTSQQTETKPTEAPKTVEPEIIISAVDLAKAYTDNEIKANQQYKDKLAEISGTIKDIGEMLGQTYVTLDSGVQYSITDVQCFFKDKDQIAKIAEMSKGTKVTIIGKIDGKSMNVGVNDCKFK